MSVTDELREFKGHINAGLAPDMVIALRAEINCIADRIDAEADDNERFRRDVEPFCDRLREAAAERADVTMFGVDYVALPVDADGLPIHIGDVMERGKARGRVIALMLSNYPNKWGGGLHWAIQLEGEQAPTALDNLFHHYKPPTVEDVLREFSCVLMGKREFDGDVTEAVAEYAKKFRLANDGEEQ